MVTKPQIDDLGAYYLAAYSCLTIQQEQQESQDQM